jgi:hypothetical protein
LDRRKSSAQIFLKIFFLEIGEVWKNFLRNYENEYKSNLGRGVGVGGSAEEMEGRWGMEAG